MVIFLIVLIFLLFIALILHLIGIVKDDGEAGRWEHMVSILLVAIVSGALTYASAIIRDTPTAMDVYEGKTELKYNITISSNDTIVDSTVVLKENK